jgi:MFS family permease
MLDAYSGTLALIWLGVGLVSFFIGGFLIDYFKKFQQFEQILNIILSIIFIISIYIPATITIMSIFIMIFLPQALLVSFSLFVSQTTVLNRGRNSMVMLMGMTVIYTSLFFYLLNYKTRFVGFLIGFILFLIVWQKYFPIPREIFTRIEKDKNKSFKLVQEEKFEEISEKNMLEQKQRVKKEKSDHLDSIEQHLVVMMDAAKDFKKTLKESGIIWLIIQTFLFSIIIGFNFSILRTKIFLEIFNIAIFVPSILISVFIAAFIIDFIGRKPLALLTGILVGVYTVFFDLSNSDWYEPLWFFLLPISISFLVMYLISIVGDLSENYRRGQIISLLVVIFILGFVAGFSFLSITGIDVDLNNQEDVTAVADFSTLIIIAYLSVLNFTPESFDPKSLHWRRYRDRIMILSKNGINLFFHKFPRYNKKTRNYQPIQSQDQDDDSDLISGGLSGIQMLLKEIAHSKQQLQILDHSDRKIIFAHGTYGTSILIATEYFEILHTKLIKFHGEFEAANQAQLQNFTGIVNNFKDLEETLKKHFG